MIEIRRDVYMEEGIQLVLPALAPITDALLALLATDLVPVLTCGDLGRPIEKDA